MPPKRIINQKKKTKTRTNMEYSEEALINALKDIRDGKGIRETCRFYGIPRTTVQDRLSGRTVEKPRKVGPDPILGFSGEEKIVKWIIQSAKCGIPIKKDDLIDTVAAIAKDLKKEHCFAEGRPGQKWYQGFLKRHPQISIREPESINKAREALKEANIRKWFSDLEAFLTERGFIDIMSDSEHILNGDETGVSLCPKTGKVLAPKGFKNLYVVKKGNEKETITVLIMMTASGLICPPLVVYPYVRPPKAVVEGTPSEWVIGKSETGWMRSDVFYEYIANDFNKWLIEKNIKKPVILFVDGHKSHMSMPLSKFWEENGIILYALPPNTTHILQPADVSVFRPLKQQWKTTVRNWQCKPENINKTITKTNFCSVFKETLDVDMAETIRNGFRKCGLYAFNMEAVDFTKCVRDVQIQTALQSKKLERNITDRHYQIAKDVILSISNNLAKRGIDAKIIDCEIEKARTIHKRPFKSKTPRNSSSKTPRSSLSKTPRSSLSKTPRYSSSETHRNSLTETSIDQIKIPSNTPNINLLHNSIIEVVDSSVPNIGSIVSLDDISIIRLDGTYSDMNLEVFSGDISEMENNLNITVAADIHCEPTLSAINLPPLNTISEVQISRNPATVCSNSPTLIIDPLIDDTVTKDLEEIKSQPLPSTFADKVDVQTDIDPFDKHLKYPVLQPKETNKKQTSSYTPSAISSKNWREYHEKKDQAKLDKENNIKKRKMEREAKKAGQVVKKRKVERKKKKPKTEMRNKIKCGACQEELISDTENNAEKNIGCDDCIRWYHLKCTKFNGLSYNIVAQSDYKCEFCESADEARQTVLKELQ